MAANIRVVSPAADRPNAWSVALIAALGLALGLGLARWAEDEPSVPESATTAAQPDAEPPPDVELVAPPLPHAELPLPLAGEGESEGTTTQPAAQVEGEGEHDSESESELTIAVTPAPPRRRGTPAIAAPGTSVRHGRVAVLRCDGAPHQTGPFPCPRDEALEAIVWAAVDSLPACETPPPPGEADLVVDFDRSAGGAAVLRARDTFRDDVVRSDGALVVSCLTTALAAAATPITGERLMFSFRFVVQ
jgi:hypothetical protein